METYNATALLKLTDALKAQPEISNVRGGHADGDSMVVYFDAYEKTYILYVFPANAGRFDAELYDQAQGETGSDDEPITEIESGTLEEIVAKAFSAL